MPRKARCVEPGLAYHVTQRGAGRPQDYRWSTASRHLAGQPVAGTIPLD